MVERVGTDNASLHVRAGDAVVDRGVSAKDHTAALKLILDELTGEELQVIKGIEEIDGVGHRAVHGAEEVRESTVIDGDLIEIIRHNAKLAPLHNPSNLMGIRGAMEVIPDVPHVAVFDTAFLSSLPPKAYRYAVPEEWYTRYRVRKYGFHGTSHRYVTLRAAQALDRDVSEINIITCHLGNGCSITAVENGKAVDHSMGMTPLEGLIMGTRSGDIDPAIPFYMTSCGLEPQQVDRELNKASGLKGVSKISNDMRDLVNHRERGAESAALAIDMFVHRLIKYIGAYYAVLPRTDMIVLTGGIGENSIPVRTLLCESIHHLGAVRDDERNEATVGGAAGPITTDSSDLPVWVIPTNEELMIARDTVSIVSA